MAPRAPGALSAGGFILDDLESARAKQLLQDQLGVEASAFVLLYTSDALTAGTPPPIARPASAAPCFRNPLRERWFDGIDSLLPIASARGAHRRACRECVSTAVWAVWDPALAGFGIE